MQGEGFSEREFSEGNQVATKTSKTNMNAETNTNTPADFAKRATDEASLIGNYRGLGEYLRADFVELADEIAKAMGRFKDDDPPTGYDLTVSVDPARIIVHLSPKYVRPRNR